MIQLKFSNSFVIKSDNPNPELIVDSLQFIGFKEVITNGNVIEFKSNFRDQNLESFQRRYGNGKIEYMIHENSLKLNVTTDLKHSFSISLLFTLILVGAAIYFGFSRKIAISELIILCSALIISFIVEYFIDRSSIRHKQERLLNLINENIKIASH